MFERLLIANRGEIACRIMRTARRLGLSTVAVYSDADRDAAHVAAADDAIHIGPAPARDSYLDIGAILNAARRSGAQAVHPGYGFLSENAEFAEACRTEGIVFVGPSPEAIRAMGSKSAGKDILRGAGVPLVPGYHGEDQDLATLRRAAEEIGWPVLVKASAGGGGRGMRVVEAPDAFDAAVAGAKRESKAAFGDDRLLIEKYLDRPRHVEMQVFGDNHGNVVHLFERDCSIQRRHQKVIEEAPAPHFPEATRRSMAEAAVAAARAIGYSGAGTIEFLLDRSGSFYFIEMNTRLQVEHPVTELITGFDLVEWQLRVAAGDPLPIRQEDIRATGHAVEVRLYAEDPARNFLPQTGRLRHLRFPADGPHVRVDSGVREGDAISIYYDPMIAKLIVWDRDRLSAIRRLRRALAETEIAGPVTNRAFLAEIAAHPAFAAGEVDTGFIDRHAADLVPPPEAPSETVLALGTAFLLEERRREAETAAHRSHDPWSPWHNLNGWRLNGTGEDLVRFRAGDSSIEVAVGYRAGGYRLRFPTGLELELRAELGQEAELTVELEGRRMAASIVRDKDELIVLADGKAHRLALFDPGAAAAAQDSSGGHLSAPMPGKIVRVLVSEGQTVKRGTALIVLEAMKMEHTIAAPADGIVERIAFGVGDQVQEGVELVVLKS